MSKDRLLLLPPALGVGQALADTPDESRLANDEVRAVTGALDQVEAYAAFLSFDPLTPEGGAKALVSGFGTGFVDGDEHAYTVLANGDAAAAERNGEAVQAIMAEKANCSSEVEVELDGALMVASCAVEKAGWVKYVYGRFGLPPFAT